MSTIIDVAREAGVSTATVSRVFNGAPVSDARAQAVRDAAARLGFVPNRAARNLRRRSSELIALIIPDVENPYYTELARGAEDVASAAGYSLVLCNSDADPAKEQRYLAVAGEERMAGVIIATSAPDEVERHLPAHAVTVAVDRTVAGHGVDEVVIDNTAAGRRAAESLVRRGATRIACISGPADVVTARDRTDGARAAGATQVIHTGFDIAGGRAATEALWDAGERPDGIVAGNNLIGAGVLQVLAERGVSLADVAVAVIGSLPFATGRTDQVSIVRLPSREMGAVAADLLLRRARGEGGEPTRVVLPAESTAAN